MFWLITIFNNKKHFYVFILKSQDFCFSRVTLAIVLRAWRILWVPSLESTLVGLPSFNFREKTPVLVKIRSVVSITSGFNRKYNGKREKDGSEIDIKTGEVLMNFNPGALETAIGNETKDLLLLVKLRSNENGNSRSILYFIKARNIIYTSAVLTF